MSHPPVLALVFVDRSAGGPGHRSLLQEVVHAVAVGVVRVPHHDAGTRHTRGLTRAGAGHTRHHHAWGQTWYLAFKLEHLASS